VKEGKREKGIDNNSKAAAASVTINYYYYSRREKASERARERKGIKVIHYTHKQASKHRYLLFVAATSR
jgi:hypothetical protein